MQDWARRFMHSSRWLSCRRCFVAKRLAIDGGVCQDCGRRLGEIAHHWPVPLTEQNISDPMVALNHDNLRWVCKPCHDLYPGHGVAKPDALLLRFDANGDAIPPYPPPGEGGRRTAAGVSENMQGVARPPSEAGKPAR